MCHSGRGSLRFYSPTGINGWLSTFSLHEIVIDSTRWPSVEHYFQAAKFAAAEISERIRRLPSPEAAKAFAKAHSDQRRSDWYAVRDEVMLRALTAKFNQHPELQSALRATGDKCLVEDSADDEYWGRGEHGSGANRLGQLLMEVRKTLLIPGNAYERR